MARITVVASTKGGVGKSTIAVNLAYQHQKAGKKVLLVCADKNATARDWTYARAEVAKDNIPCVQILGKRVDVQLNQLSGEYEEIVVDAGCHDSYELRSSLLVANYVLCPVQVSNFDLWTLDDLQSILGDAEAAGGSALVRMVISRAPTNASSSDTMKARDQVQQHGVFELMRPMICERVSFRRSCDTGLTIFEYLNDRKQADEKAQIEMTSVFKALYK